jgi:hypothetical protein
MYQKQLSFAQGERNRKRREMCEPRPYRLPLPQAIGARIKLEEFPDLDLKVVKIATIATSPPTHFLILEVFGKLAELRLGGKVGGYEFSNVSISMNDAGNGFASFSICKSPLAGVVGGGSQIDDTFALEVEALWKESFLDATLLPKVGLPSNNRGVLTLTHTDGSGKLLKINGLASKSFLANNALYSAELAEDGEGGESKVLNLYEIMLPDIAGKSGGESTVQVYLRLLTERGLQVSGVHFHWFGTDRLVAAIHHQNVGLDPLTFSRLTIEALKGTLALMS